jgi:hypothetical protein
MPTSSGIPNFVPFGAGVERYRIKESQLRQLLSIGSLYPEIPRQSSLGAAAVRMILMTGGASKKKPDRGICRATSNEKLGWVIISIYDSGLLESRIGPGIPGGRRLSYDWV